LATCDLANIDRCGQRSIGDGRDNCDRNRWNNQLASHDGVPSTRLELLTNQGQPPQVRWIKLEQQGAITLT
jgi:hypothetical protein